MTPQQLSARHVSLHFLTVPYAQCFGVIGGFLVIALILLGVGFGRPQQKLAPLPGAYQQSWEFLLHSRRERPNPRLPRQDSFKDPVSPSIQTSSTTLSCTSRLPVRLEA